MSLRQQLQETEIPSVQTTEAGIDQNPLSSAWTQGKCLVAFREQRLHEAYWHIMQSDIEQSQLMDYL